MHSLRLCIQRLFSECGDTFAAGLDGHVQRKKKKTLERRVGENEQIRAGQGRAEQGTDCALMPLELTCLTGHVGNWRKQEVWFRLRTGLLGSLGCAVLIAALRAAGTTGHPSSTSCPQHHFWKRAIVRPRCRGHPTPTSRPPSTDKAAECKTPGPAHGNVSEAMTRLSSCQEHHLVCRKNRTQHVCTEGRRAFASTNGGAGVNRAITPQRGSDAVLQVQTSYVAPTPTPKPAGVPQGQPYILHEMAVCTSGETDAAVSMHKAAVCTSRDTDAAGGMLKWHYATSRDTQEQAECTEWQYAQSGSDHEAGSFSPGELGVGAPGFGRLQAFGNGRNGAPMLEALIEDEQEGGAGASVGW
eukprot:scaffold24186_cov25-Tisochrysis_lutea.AAC.1